MVEGEVRKHSWVRTDTRLIELIRQGLRQKEYPLFVAEGDSDKKLEQIQRSGYLSYCLGKLERIEQSLVIYGLSLGDNDQHIANVLADNPALERIFVGTYEDLNTPAGLALQQAATRMAKRRKQNLKRIKGSALSVEFYDSKTAHVWD